MLRFTVFFSLGVLVFHQLSWLPDWRWALFEIVMTLCCLLVWRSVPVGALLAGVTWSHIYALLMLPASLPGEQQILDVAVSGHVVSLVERSDQVTRFLFEADQVEGLEAPLAGRWLLRLSWWDAPHVDPGEAWRLPVRLRAAHGYATPGAWDYEGWLYWQGIRYTGYVSRDAEPRLVSRGACCALTRLRSQLSAAIDALPVSSWTRGVIRALTVGDRSGLGHEDRAVLHMALRKWADVAQAIQPNEDAAILQAMRRDGFWPISDESGANGTPPLVSGLIAMQALETATAWT